MAKAFTMRQLFQPSGDQPQAIAALNEGLQDGLDVREGRAFRNNAPEPQLLCGINVLWVADSGGLNALPRS